MIDLKAMFPKGSKSFFSANAPLSQPSEPNKTPSTGNVERIKGKRGGVSISAAGEPYWSEGKKGRHGMNKTESEFAMILEAMKRKGEILRYEFEGVTLRFAGVRYTPDFVVFGHIDDPAAANFGAPFVKLIEVKGPWIKGNRERAVERFRHAKTFWPEFTFELHQKTRNGWRQII